MADAALEVMPDKHLQFAENDAGAFVGILTLRNPSDHFLTFKVMTNRAELYCVRPNQGLLPPHKQVTLTVLVEQEKAAELHAEWRAEDAKVRASDPAAIGKGTVVGNMGNFFLRKRKGDRFKLMSLIVEEARAREIANMGIGALEKLAEIWHSDERRHAWEMRIKCTYTTAVPEVESKEEEAEVVEEAREVEGGRPSEGGGRSGGGGGGGGGGGESGGGIDKSALASASTVVVRSGVSEVEGLGSVGSLREVEGEEEEEEEEGGSVAREMERDTALEVDDEEIEGEVERAEKEELEDVGAIEEAERDAEREVRAVEEERKRIGEGERGGGEEGVVPDDDLKSQYDRLVNDALKSRHLQEELQRQLRKIGMERDQLRERLAELEAEAAAQPTSTVRVRSSASSMADEDADEDEEVTPATSYPTPGSHPSSKPPSSTTTPQSASSIQLWHVVLIALIAFLVGRFLADTGDEGQ